MVASGFAQLQPATVPEAAIDEDGLAATTGTDAAAWAAIRDHHEEEEEERRAQGSGELAEEGSMGEARPHIRNQAHDTSEGRHAIRTRGGLVWCDVCGAYGVERSGSRLMGPCQPRVTRHAATRLERLRQGKHPITVVSLT